MNGKISRVRKTNEETKMDYLVFIGEIYGVLPLAIAVAGVGLALAVIAKLKGMIR